jgi:hypothetical protein
VPEVSGDTPEFNGIDKTEIRANQSKACLGFLSINILSPPKGTIWGAFNDRKLNDDAVNKLVAGFKADLENCTDKTAIDVAMRKSWLKDGVIDKAAKSVEGLKIEDVCKVELNAKGEIEMQDDSLWMLGGNHRRAALALYVKEKKADIEKAQREIAKADKKGSDERAMAAIKELEDKVEKASWWAIKVYDRGECTITRWKGEKEADHEDEDMQTRSTSTRSKCS